MKQYEYDLRKGRSQGSLVDRHSDLFFDDFDGDPGKGAKSENPTHLERSSTIQLGPQIPAKLALSAGCDEGGIDRATKTRGVELHDQST